GLRESGAPPQPLGNYVNSALGNNEKFHIHALIHGRMPGRRLQAAVRFPRLWGVGALLVVVALGLHSAWLLGVAVGIVIIGHVAKRAV
ncbi:hypothetical protein, partial [Streptomyces sp. NPDC059893]|uniref:hypothetical protein n=1 Tax=Streptomyces sp. NPDC059893 TaxID=3346990 RepID=UPI003658568C